MRRALALADRRGISLEAALGMSNWEAELWLEWYFPTPAADELPAAELDQFLREHSE